MDFLEFEDCEYMLRFKDVTQIADHVFCKLRNDCWYEVCGFNYDGAAVIVLEDGQTFALTEEEMRYVEIKALPVKVYESELDFLQDEKFYESLELYEDYMNFNPAAHIHITAKVNTKYDYGLPRNGDKTDMSELEVETWVRMVEREVNRRYIDAEIDRLLSEPVLNAEELSKLVGIKYRKST